MTTITLPKTTRKNENFIAVPQGVYAEFLAWQKAIKSARVFIPTVAEKKALARGRKNFAKGKFFTLEQVHCLSFPT